MTTLKSRVDKIVDKFFTRAVEGVLNDTFGVNSRWGKVEITSRSNHGSQELADFARRVANFSALRHAFESRISEFLTSNPKLNEQLSEVDDGFIENVRGLEYSDREGLRAQVRAAGQAVAEHDFARIMEIANEKVKSENK
jgi:hypothetical protein